MSKLKVGDAAPEIDLLASNGKNVSLKDFSGRNIVLYFYPKDDTPGCTVEACSFRDEIRSVEGQNAVVLGVSPDGLKSHEKFVEKFKLPFLLLADEAKKTCRDYRVWVKKSMYGREYLGVERTTFIIDKKGRIAKIFENVKPKEHVAEVLQVLQGLN